MQWEKSRDNAWKKAKSKIVSQAQLYQMPESTKSSTADTTSISWQDQMEALRHPVIQYDDGWGYQTDWMGLQ